MRLEAHTQKKEKKDAQLEGGILLAPGGVGWQGKNAIAHAPQFAGPLVMLVWRVQPGEKQSFPNLETLSECRSRLRFEDRNYTCMMLSRNCQTKNLSVK